MNGTAPACRGTTLVIDDDVLVLQSLAAIIECWGYSVLAASSEAEALDLVSRSPVRPGMILTDYRLCGERTGMHTVASVRKLMGCSIPAVIITGDTEPGRLKNVEGHGLEVLFKPVPPARLEKVVRKLMGS